ncbi:hypothetical protein [Motiliproteus sp. SC1-56]|uniref:hypothetical protein n=1 Tax=Motiliproteus sp. SC1-56 TaxID=2799565 RepID=UPI001A90A0E6|nr:hypothetical protein [Motiliproteus sp. SC1-56]
MRQPGRARVLFLSLGLAFPLAAAERYCLRTDAARGITDGDTHQRSKRGWGGQVGKAEEGCYDLRFIKGKYAALLDRDGQVAYESAPEQLQRAPDSRASLPPEIGSRIYYAAYRAWIQTFIGD